MKGLEFILLFSVLGSSNASLGESALHPSLLARTKKLGMFENVQASIRRTLQQKSTGTTFKSMNLTSGVINNNEPGYNGTARVTKGGDMIFWDKGSFEGSTCLIVDVDSSTTAGGYCGADMECEYDRFTDNFICKKTSPVNVPHYSLPFVSCSSEKNHIKAGNMCVNEPTTCDINSCDTNYFCDTGSGKCVKKARLYENCTSTHESCEGLNTKCVPTYPDMTKTCVVADDVISENVPCNLIETQEEVVWNGICTKNSTSNDPMIGFIVPINQNSNSNCYKSEQCDDDFYCDTVTHDCKPIKTVGMKCDNNYECTGNTFCSNNICKKNKDDLFNRGKDTSFNGEVWKLVVLYPQTYTLKANIENLFISKAWGSTMSDATVWTLYDEEWFDVFEKNADFRNLIQNKVNDYANDLSFINDKSHMSKYMQTVAIEDHSGSFVTIYDRTKDIKTAMEAIVFQILNERNAFDVPGERISPISGMTKEQENAWFFHIAANTSPERLRLLNNVFNITRSSVYQSTNGVYNLYKIFSDGGSVYTNSFFNLIELASLVQNSPIKKFEFELRMKQWFHRTPWFLSAQDLASIPDIIEKYNLPKLELTTHASVQRYGPSYTSQSNIGKTPKTIRYPIDMLSFIDRSTEMVLQSSLDSYDFTTLSHQEYIQSYPRAFHDQHAHIYQILLAWHLDKHVENHVFQTQMTKDNLKELATAVSLSVHSNGVSFAYGAGTQILNRQWDRISSTGEDIIFAFEIALLAISVLATFGATAGVAIAASVMKMTISFAAAQLALGIASCAQQQLDGAENADVGCAIGIVGSIIPLAAAPLTKALQTAKLTFLGASLKGFFPKLNDFVNLATKNLAKGINKLTPKALQDLIKKVPTNMFKDKIKNLAYHLDDKFDDIVRSDIYDMAMDSVLLACTVIKKEIPDDVGCAVFHYIKMAGDAGRVLSLRKPNLKTSGKPTIKVDWSDFNYNAYKVPKEYRLVDAFNPANKIVPSGFVYNYYTKMVDECVYATAAGNTNLLFQQKSALYQQRNQMFRDTMSFAQTLQFQNNFITKYDATAFVNSRDQVQRNQIPTSIAPLDFVLLMQKMFKKHCGNDLECVYQQLYSAQHNADHISCGQDSFKQDVYTLYKFADNKTNFCPWTHEVDETAKSDQGIMNAACYTPEKQFDHKTQLRMDIAGAVNFGSGFFSESEYQCCASQKRNNLGFKYSIRNSKNLTIHTAAQTVLEFTDSKRDNLPKCYSDPDCVYAFAESMYSAINVHSKLTSMYLKKSGKFDTVVGSSGSARANDGGNSCGYADQKHNDETTTYKTNVPVHRARALGELYSVIVQSDGQITSKQQFHNGKILYLPHADRDYVGLRYMPDFDSSRNREKYTHSVWFSFNPDPEEYEMNYNNIGARTITNDYILPGEDAWNTNSETYHECNPNNITTAFCPVVEKLFNGVLHNVSTTCREIDAFIKQDDWNKLFKVAKCLADTCYKNSHCPDHSYCLNGICVQYKYNQIFNPPDEPTPSTDQQLRLIIDPTDIFPKEIANLPSVDFLLQVKKEEHLPSDQQTLKYWYASPQIISYDGIRKLFKPSKRLLEYDEHKTEYSTKQFPLRNMTYRLKNQQSHQSFTDAGGYSDHFTKAENIHAGLFRGATFKLLHETFGAKTLLNCMKKFREFHGHGSIITVFDVTVEQLQGNIGGPAPPKEFTALFYKDDKCYLLWLKPTSWEEMSNMKFSISGLEEHNIGWHDKLTFYLPRTPPTARPTAQPTAPTAKPTAQPTAKPTAQPTAKPTFKPTTPEPTFKPTTPAPTMSVTGFYNMGSNTACRGNEMFYLTTAATLTECQQKCMNTHDCNGIEFQTTGTRCELWYGPIHNAVTASGYNCQRFTRINDVVAGYTIVGTDGKSGCSNNFITNPGTSSNVYSVAECEAKCNLNKECTGFEYTTGMISHTCVLWNANILSSSPYSSFLYKRTCYRRNIKTPLALFTSNMYISTSASGCSNQIANVKDGSTENYMSIGSSPALCQSMCSNDPTCTGAQYEKRVSFITAYYCTILRRQITSSVVSSVPENVCSRRMLKTSSLATCDAGLKSFNTMSYTMSSTFTESMCASNCIANPLCKGVSYTMPASGTNPVCSYHYSNVMGVIPWTSTISPPKVQSCMVKVLSN